MSLAYIARSTVACWLLLHASIKGKHGEMLAASEFALNKLQQEVANIIAYCEKHNLPCRIIGLKARQVGLSTLSMAAMYHACRRKPTNCLLIGDEYEKSVANLEAMFWRFAETDTFDWQDGGLNLKRKSLAFPNGSKFVTDTAGDNRAGASGTYQFMVITEAAHFKSSTVLNPALVLQAALACVPKDSGVVIIESTANGEGNAYHTLYTGAITFEEFKRHHQAGTRPTGWNGYIKVFLAWHEHAEYRTPVSPAEAIEIMQTLSERERELVDRFPHIDAARLRFRRDKIAGPECLGNEQKFDQEYPSDEDTAFLVTGSRIFHQPTIRTLQDRARNILPKFGVLDVQSNSMNQRPFPVWRPCLTEVDAWLKVWEMPIVGMHYWIAADTAEGASATVGEDPDNHSVKVWRKGFRDKLGKWWPDRCVARLTDCGEEMANLHQNGKYLAACRWDIDILAERIMLVSDWFGQCIVCPEFNSTGGWLINRLVENGYPVYQQQQFNKTTQKNELYRGWRTTAQNREGMISEIIRRIRYHDSDGDGIEIFDPYTLAQYVAFARSATGKPQAMTGWHDDEVMNDAIAMQCRESATVMREVVVRVTDELEAIRRRNMASRWDYAG